MHYLVQFGRIVVSGYGSVWSERTAGGREVAGSNPVTPMNEGIAFEISESYAFLLFKPTTLYGLIIAV